MSTLTIARGDVGIPSQLTNRGMSDAAQTISGRVREIIETLREPASTGGSYSEARVELQEAALNCAVPDWDGYGAEPVYEGSLEFARELLLALPTSIPAPEISVDPDGEVALDWFGPRGSMFSVSVGPGGELSYAGRFGVNTAHGTEQFADELPRSIVSNIRRLFSR